MSTTIQNKIQIKRGNSAPTVGILDEGEPGYDLKNKCLYIGNGIDIEPTAIPNEAYVAQKIAEATIHKHAGESLSPGNLELHPGASAGHGGYIDFHYNNSGSDYTSRIIEQASGTLNIQATGLTHNSNKILTKSDIIDKYNAPLTFSNGIATYENSAIKYTSVVIVQRRGNVAGANMSFTTQTQDGVATICTDSSVNGTIYVNMIISYL